MRHGDAPPSPAADAPSDLAGAGELAQEHWQRVKAVFLAAVERAPSDRLDYIAEVCAGDAALQREVESLLASDAAAGSFIESPAAVLIGAAPAPRLERPRLPPGSRVGAYEIVEFIAAGGMGQVYRARHTVLGREVAIKTVGADLVDDSARRRLIREARHASTLSHPNVCTIYEVGETEGNAPFIVMELVRGRPLAEEIRERPPALSAVLSYGLQVAAALAHAHSQGIVHRDLKSSNVVIGTGGDAKVLDFGLARRTGGGVPRDSTITSDHVMAGTLSHMAPEVLRGERGDERSDVWALGVLLYELTTGELPFAGRTSFETSSAILADPPKPMSSRVPIALRLVIERCLVKNPDARYQNAQAVHAALAAIQQRRAWPIVGRLLVSMHRRAVYSGIAALLILSLAPLGIRAAMDARAVPTVALLPLEDDRSPAGDYYTEGVTDALIAQLGAATDVRVFSRASTTSAARGAAGTAQLFERLGARVLVRGSIRRADGRVTITVRVWRAGDVRPRWSETFEREERDILALQADVVRGLAFAVHSGLRPGLRERLAAVRAVSPAVYEEYLKGRYEWNKRTQASLLRAVVHFARAVELDDSYAPAHAALADCYNQLGTVMVGSGSPREFRPRAADEAMKALRIDPYSAEAHAALGFVRHYQLRWAEAERELQRAIELNPSYALARLWYANLLMSRSRYDEALRQVYMARDLDPFSLITNTNVGWILTNAGRYPEAIAQLERTVAMDTAYVQARWRLIDALAMSGRPEDAVALAGPLVALSDSAMPVLALQAQVTALAGNDEEARSLLANLLTRARTRYVPPGAIAEVYAALGEIDTAVTWMERAFEEGSNMIAYIASPEHRSLRQSARFRALLARAGLE